MKVSELFPYTFKAMKQRRTDSRPMWQQRQSANSDFCLAMVTQGYLTEGQMRQFLSQFPEMAPWMPESHHCLFGLHQISLADGADNADKVAVVEAEKTAVILSAHFPEYLWLAAGGLFELTADKLFPLRSHPIVLFPDTDPEGRAYARWYDVAREARHCYGCRITVSSLLERRATTAQKAAKIDLADLLFENKPQ